MGTSMQNELNKRIRLSKNRRRAVAVLACVSLVVAFCVTAIVKQRGMAASHEQTILDCHATGAVAHTHTDECYDEAGNLVCPLPERALHAHDDSCYQEQQILVCELPEDESHTHTSECYQTELVLVCGQEEITEEHVHGPGCFVTLEVEDPEPVVPMPAQTFDHSFVGADGVEQLKVAVDAPEGAFPEGTTMVATWVDAQDVQDTVEKTVGEQTEGVVAKIQAVDIAFFDATDAEIEPAQKITVTMTSSLIAQNDNSMLVHVDDKGKADVVDPLSDRELKQRDLTPSADELTFDSNQFSIYAIAYVVDLSYEVDGKTFTFTIQGGDSASLRQLVSDLGVVDPNTTASKYAAETADPAASADPIDAFMADIARVEFSNPQLVGVYKVEQDITVGQIVSSQKMHVVYPLGLTQDEVLALNDKRYVAGDWVLISLLPFTSEETLTVTMKDDEAFVIKVTDAQDAVMNGDGTVQTISNPAGTTIDLFDYWIVNQGTVGRDAWPELNQGWGGHADNEGLNGSGNNKGINADGSANGHALKFSPAWEGTVYNGTKNGWTSLNANGRDGLNSYTGGINPFPGIVQGTLGSDGYPTLTNNGTIGSNGESLAYLFDPSISHGGKASYAGVNQLLYVDSQGYYTYDSRDYRADFNTGSKTFTLTEQTSNNSEIRGFWPFGIQNFWVGAHINTQFSMPTDGQVLNPAGVYKPMQFEFSGDDDVWIYVDGVLVGDAGGIHNRTEVDINFQTGNVIINGASQGTLHSIFAAAGAADRYEWEGETFKAGTYHTFDFFYLERGGGESNMYIHYNLVSTADFTAHKSYHGQDEKDILRRDQFQFELIGLDGRYDAAGNLVDAGAQAIMPNGGSADGAGTIASPKLVVENGRQVFTTGVTEDGNVNFGTAQISEQDMHDCDTGNPPVYHYIVREYVPADATIKRSDGSVVTYAEATDEEKAAGGFIKDGVVYDATVYYMGARVTSWKEVNASGREYNVYGLSKTYYTDDTFTTVKSDVTFANFTNERARGNVEFDKVDTQGNPMAGATFGLFRDAACTIAATDGEGNAITATSVENGKVRFANVRCGIYYMKETEAPSPYALDETVYQVTIVDQSGVEGSSTIVAVGDEAKIPVTQIVNNEAGKITVVKHWLDRNGNEISGGSNAVTVALRRRGWTAHQTSSEHSVTVHHSVEDGGQKWCTARTVSVVGDTVVIEWDDEWQRNFNYWITVGNRSYEGWIGDEVVEADGYTIEQISSDGRSRRLTITDVDGDVTVTTKYWVNWLHSDGNHWNNLNNNITIVGSGAETSYEEAEDTTFNAAGHKANLVSPNWSYSWSIGGSEANHAGYDFAAVDANGQAYRYYFVELDEQGNDIAVGDSPTEGYELDHYSANNAEGIAQQGVVDVYNKSNQSTVDITILKVDGKHRTKALEGAEFYLLKGKDRLMSLAITSLADGSEVAQDSEGCFAVPKEGVLVSGLDAGEYTLVETKAPNGYIITSNGWQFSVADGAVNGENNIVSGLVLTIPNEPGAALPMTGGIGSAVVRLAGFALVTMAIGLVILSRRIEREGGTWR